MQAPLDSDTSPPHSTLQTTPEFSVLYLLSTLTSQCHARLIWVKLKFQSISIKWEIGTNVDFNEEITISDLSNVSVIVSCWKTFLFILDLKYIYNVSESWCWGLEGSLPDTRRIPGQWSPGKVLCHVLSAAPGRDGDVPHSFLSQVGNQSSEPRGLYS